MVIILTESKSHTQKNNVCLCTKERVISEKEVFHSMNQNKVTNKHNLTSRSHVLQLPNSSQTLAMVGMPFHHLLLLKTAPQRTLISVDSEIG